MVLAICRTGQTRRRPERYQLESVPRGNPGRTAQGAPKILFVGIMFGKRKGLHDLIAVAPKILEVHPKTRFVLAGSDVEDRVRAELEFTGDLDPEGVANAYATCFVLPLLSMPTTPERLRRFEKGSMRRSRFRGLGSEASSTRSSVRRMPSRISTAGSSRTRET